MFYFVSVFTNGNAVFVVSSFTFRFCVISSIYDSKYLWAYCCLVQIKVLLMAVKGFNPESGDSAYTMGIVDLLLECVELSYRPGK